MLTPCGVKSTQKYLKISTAKRTSLLTHGPKSQDFLTGATNGKSKDTNHWQTKWKNHISRVANWTLTYALSHGGYRMKYRVAWWVIIMTSLQTDWHHDKLCLCYGVRDFLQVCSQSSCRWVLTAKGSADSFGFFWQYGLRAPPFHSVHSLLQYVQSHELWDGLSIEKIKCFRFLLPTFPISHPANMNGSFS